MNFNLKNKYALVCGSTSGIGKATAILLAEEGAQLTLVARNEDKLKHVCSELPNPERHAYIVADFSNPTDLKQKLETFIKKQHSFHILVNNTGGPKAGPVFSATLDAFELGFTQHLKCNHILAQTVVPFMKAEEFGRIINIISTSVKQPLDGLGVSNTIRGAVANWSKTLSNELAAFGITVNNVLPGATETNRLFDIIKDSANKTEQTEATVTNNLKATIPANRFAKPEEIANAIAFLASEQAAYINGINLPVDGGRTKSL
ncbi:3-oxoacyl-[acyl-carrier protein] reductase [Formosa agariphila KMM 3901]|uniref:3-oxoacyl-[acyl-carrier protein] reductase n=1 Tax=Formosa agariphila (strain DSM 15362 / KCTC 12365 / LMG 23005 / KMM 3901 / M-2Alg 35-1) TaxID=1347342 RepID=T2KPW8_FORAG|nr:SDR family oxidoreductase [Formosa agariphila]CDF80501.1 3-oxoacyl-[acyl-carrier protein] reductase [Formosa agariphila KMM 3901]